MRERWSEVGRLESYTRIVYVTFVFASASGVSTLTVTGVTPRL